MKKRLIVISLLLVFALLLGGCSAIKGLKAEQDKFDATARQLIAAFAEKDLDAVSAMAYDEQSRQALSASFDEYAANWPACSDDNITCTNFGVNVSSNGPTVYQGEYTLETDESNYALNLVYQSDSSGAGFTSARLTEVPGAKKLEAASRVLSPVLLVLWLLFVAFAVLTIIDIIKKKPKRYGLWIAVALIFFGFGITSGSGSFSANFNFMLLGRSRFEAFSNGSYRILLSLPLGAIIYWCSRKSLLKKKAKYAVPAPEEPR